MKWLLYNCLFAVAYTAMMPMFLLRMKRRGGYRARMGDRFGKYTQDVIEKIPAEKEKSLVWIHAVSVGEVFVAAQMMNELRKKDPSIRFLFSTTSSTGWKQAEKYVGDDDILIYNPLDFPLYVKRAVDTFNPRAVILTESELWPNFIRQLNKRGVPLFLINARVSDRSAPRYKKMRWFFGDVLRSFTRIFAQSKLDSDRLVAAGADNGNVKVTGSFKFDVAKRNESKEEEVAKWVSSDGEKSRILLGGSMWPGEDEVLLRIFSKLESKYQDVKLVIVPRHFEKADAVEKNICDAGFDCVRRSRTEQIDTGKKKVYLADTTGEMMGFYGISSVAFVGKSLCEHGSQNMIEPCLCGVATLVGPNTENFRPVMSDLLSARAIVQVKDEEELLENIESLFADQEKRLQLGERARNAVLERCGVVGRCAEEILEVVG
ncbi:MAG: 3-deoxy-D-manno-octulosonic acid transferase [Kiritimatiellae bacterium]|nr:3-deoxy-D-manno-octulosonic acid transferase [Kiritimatiellia bacterium]